MSKPNKTSSLTVDSNIDMTGYDFTADNVTGNVLHADTVEVDHLEELTASAGIAIDSGVSTALTLLKGLVLRTATVVATYASGTIERYSVTGKVEDLDAWASQATELKKTTPANIDTSVFRITASARFYATEDFGGPNSSSARLYVDGSPVGTVVSCPNTDAHVTGQYGPVTVVGPIDVTVGASKVIELRGNTGSKGVTRGYAFKIESSNPVLTFSGDTTLAFIDTTTVKSLSGWA